MKKHNLICIMGRTGVGKDTVVDILCEKYNLKKLISNTTRPPRYDGESTHNFLTEFDFERDFTENKVVADTVINNIIYWSTIDQLFENDVYIIDPIGLKKLYKNIDTEKINIIPIYLFVDYKTRLDRALRCRGDNEEKFTSRNLSESKQFYNMLLNENFKYAIKNDNADNAAKLIKEILDIEGA